MSTLVPTSTNSSSLASSNALPIDPTQLIQQPQQPPKSPTPEPELIAFWESEMGKARADRIVFERQWYLSMAFYFGKQWVTWTGTTDFTYARLFEPRPKPWSVRLVANRIKPLVRKEISRLNSEKPRGFVVPSSSDDDDTAAARAAESIHEYLCDQIKLETLMWQTDFWTVLFGTGFIKDYWSSGETDDNNVSGRVRAIACSPFHIFVPNMEEEDIDNQPWIIHASIRSPYEIKQQYGIDVPAEEAVTVDALEARLLQASNIRQQSARKGVLVKECWMKPNEHFPDGGLFVWAADRVLYQDARPLREIYKHGQFPFTRRLHIQTGRFYGEGLPVDLIPLQQEYNRGRSQLIENRNLTSRPQIMYPKGSITGTKWDSRPGLQIPYAPQLGGKPEYLQVPATPNYVMELLQEVLTDMADISSQHDASQGHVRNGAQAATAIAALQEADSTMVAFSIGDKEKACERLGRHLLSHAAQFWDAERTVKIVGSGEAFEAFIFSKASIGENTDYRVITGSALPMSRAAKQAFIMDLIKGGIIPPAKGLQYLQMGETAKLYEELQVDVRQAQRENLKISQGAQDIPVNDYDEDLQHLATHDDFRKRQEFENAEPQVKAVMRHHVYVHLMNLASKAGIPIQTPSSMDMAMQSQNEQQMMQVMQEQQQMGQYYVDPLKEMELRNTYMLLRQTGGIGPTQQPMQQSGGQAQAAG